MKILTALRLCTLGKYEIYLMIMAASTLWNNLPGDLRVLDSVDIFKSKLKTHLFGLVYHDFL